MERKYSLICFTCGKRFEHSNEYKKYCCEECAEEARKKARRKYMRKIRAKASCEIKTLREIERERREYNEKHGTHLSYGQYVNMVEGC